MSPVIRQFCVVSTCAIGLALLVRGLNHHLASWQLNLSIGGLLIAPAALRLHSKTALFSAFATGLALDAATPVPFGENALLMLAATTLVLGARHRIPREELSVGIAVAIVINLLLFSARTFLHMSDWPDPSSGWLRIFSDLVASQLFIAVIAPWFFALQRHSLFWLDADYSVARPERY